MFDIAFDHPDAWPHGTLAGSDNDHMVIGQDILTTDLCQLDGHCYVRGVLQIPIKDSDQIFGFGIWGTLSTENFTAYCNYDGTSTPFVGAFSWIANSMPTFETDAFLAADMELQSDRTRPLIFAHTGSPLHDAQSDGITLDHLLDIYAASGTDIRPHL